MGRHDRRRRDFPASLSNNVCIKYSIVIVASLSIAWLLLHGNSTRDSDASGAHQSMLHGDLASDRAQFRRQSCDGAGVWAHALQPDDVRHLDCAPTAMVEYAVLHRSLRHESNARTITYFCQEGCGGLGDRLKGIVTAYLLGILSGRVVLLDQRRPTSAEDIILPGSAAWAHGVDWRLT